MNLSLFSKRVYSSSLTPFEILKTSKDNMISYKQMDKDFYIDYWKKNISKNMCDEVFSKYCKDNKLNTHSISLMISNVSLDKHFDYPEWVYILHDFYNFISSKKIKSLQKKDGEKRICHFFSPFLSFFGDKYIKPVLTSTSFLTDDLTNQLNVMLYEELYDIANLTLSIEFEEYRKTINNKKMEENIYYGKFILYILHDKYEALFLKYPLLAKKLITTAMRFVNFITNIFNRLEVDKKDLEKHFKIKIDYIKEIILGMGDKHNGESVAIIELESSNKIVYKPSNISITNAYNNFRAIKTIYLK